MSTLFSHFFQKFNQISPLEHNFTEVLDCIALKPKTLYFYGKMPENVSKNGVPERPKTVAIVGSRHNTYYGEEVAYRLAYELAKNHVVIISGLAFGIDSIAHRAALDAGGITVAVLGTPIDEIYPRSHLPLAGEIIKTGGAILSEYAPNTKIYPKTSFLERNRLISGLSDVVVVVEAAVRSGSLNTAAHALSQGKEVFAVPGNITSPYSKGCNKLIAQGAYPYSEPNDILRLLFPDDFIKHQQKLSGSHLIGDNEVETTILKSLAMGLRSGEEIMQQNHLPVEVFNQSITILEIKGRVHSLGANNWSLN